MSDTDFSKLKQTKKNLEDKQYNITEYYWLINPKFSEKIKLDDGEIEFVILSYNNDFNNYRISCYNLNNSIINGAIYKNKVQMLFNVNVFPETFDQINYIITNGKIINDQLKSQPDKKIIHNIERLYTDSTFKPTRSIFEISNGYVTLKSRLNDKTYYYKFSEYQLDSFLTFSKKHI